jgi:hypothetical protein
MPIRQQPPDLGGVQADGLRQLEIAAGPGSPDDRRK